MQKCQDCTLNRTSVGFTPKVTLLLVTGNSKCDSEEVMVPSFMKLENWFRSY
jgi:hypothetical protein